MNERFSFNDKPIYDCFNVVAKEEKEEKEENEEEKNPDNTILWAHLQELRKNNINWGAIS